MAVRDAAHPVLRSLARGDALDQAEVPDLLNIVTERVLARRRAGHQIDDLALYAKQAARNVFRDWLRRKRRQREHVHRHVSSESSTSLLDRLYDSNSLTPSSLVAQHDDQRRHAPMIRDAFASLSPTERAVFDLRFAQGRSSAEVAQILGYNSPGVVDTTVSRARKKLRDRLPQSLMDPILGTVIG